MPCVPGNIGSRWHPDDPDLTSLSFTNCSDVVQMGDLVLDVGANVGQYTLRLSESVGGEGRVIAFEPIVETAEILAAMARRARYRNITLFNIAVSERAGLPRFRVPSSATGLPNYFQARVSRDGDRTIPCFALDELPFPHRIALVKVNLEEHEVSVIRGMRNPWLPNATENFRIHRLQVWCTSRRTCQTLERTRRTTEGASRVISASLAR